MSRGFGFRAFGMGYVVAWVGWRRLDAELADEARGWRCGPVMVWTFP